MRLSSYSGDRDGFVAKLTDAGSSGTFVWAQQFGGWASDRATSLAVSGTSVYVGGYYQSPTATFGSLTLTNPSAGFLGDGYVAKVEDAGTTSRVVWAQRIGGRGNETVEALAVQGNGLYLTGAFGQEATAFGSTVLLGAGATDVFVAKLTDAGPSSTFTWAQAAGSTADESGTALAVQGANVYVGGFFTGQLIRFGPLSLTNRGSSGFDGFVAKLTDAGATGSFTWVQSVASTGRQSDEYLSAVVPHGNGVCITGSFGSPSISFGTTTLLSAGIFSLGDIFVAQLDDQGTSSSWAWAQRAGSPEIDQGNALAIVGTDVYVGGYVSTPASFGSLPPVGALSGIGSGFLARLGEASTVRISGATEICAGGQVPLQATPSALAATYVWSTGATTATITVTQPGTYTVTATFPGGATATAMHQVVGIQPVVSILGDTLLCPGGSIRLTASAPGAASLRWNTGSPLTTLDVTSPGVYELTATYGAGCSVTRRVTVVGPSVTISGPMAACVSAGSPALLTALAPGATTFRWSTGATTASISTAQTGTYQVTATFPAGCTATASYAVLAPVAAITGQTLLCPGATTTLSARDAAAAAYRWNTGATGPELVVGEPGIYSVRVTFPGGCSSEAQHVVQQLPGNPPFTLGADTTLCEGQGIVLQLPALPDAAGTTYRWSDGSTGATLRVQAAGTYSVERRTNCGVQTASRRIEVQRCWLVPNVVTPNGDGKNDRFAPQGLQGDWSLEVFNRWGKQVYTAETYRNEWGDVPAGIYYYVLRQPGSTHVLRGWVEVMGSARD
ncbi:gliding motility-associated C-terminal domain-containing protein [Hymenobacter aquaticus]|uniref:Gliding motility-associated C-terminal domain-containing protein n=1 Tax=Hymenobacter aquaticus TaxID=1867101 RepID=A0A4Z0Q672_9BACT|nr:gliding motility-associated C-terminal domain-containing protein [Hymenobacter aquaticus]TGE25144.1 gliding motility-associated C-terminal domain-containing protein [Hymenobacter aquaticus]